MYVPHEADPNASMDVAFPDGLEVTATRDNTTLTTFFGDLALYDHVSIIVGEDPENMFGIEERFVFCDDPRYHSLWELIVQNDFPQLRNLNEATEDVLGMYAAQHESPEAVGVPEAEVSKVLGNFDAELVAFLEGLGPGEQSL